MRKLLSLFRKKPPAVTSWKSLADKVNQTRVEDGISALWLPMVAKIEAKAATGEYEYYLDKSEVRVFNTDTGKAFLKGQGLLFETYSGSGWVRWDK